MPVATCTPRPGGVRPRPPVPAVASALAGIGLGLRHLGAIQSDPSPPALVEIHAENWFTPSGPLHAALDRVRARSGLAIHGVGLSIGGEEPLDVDHLDALAALVRRHPPLRVSEHLAWTRHGDHHLPDLLPLRYDHASLLRTCRHIDQVQTRLGRQLLVENPARYLSWHDGDFDEPGFIHELVRRTGCGLLLDLCNLLVTCTNERLDARRDLDRLPLHAVAEVHLAGPARRRDADGGALLVDDHARAVTAPVWALYDRLLARIGPVPTVIEWDNGDPAYDTLCGEAARAARRLHAATAELLPA